MIVYAGKQFGNDFNNGDEGVFQDASRPRDNDMFKIKPGLQSDKWDWKRANKNTQPMLSIFSGVGRSAVTGTTDGQVLQLGGISRFFSGKATASDFSDYSTILEQWGGVNYVVDLANAQREQNKLYSYSNFRVTSDGLIECLNSGTYLLGIACQLRYASGHNTSTAYKEYAYLYATDSGIENGIAVDSFSRRSTGNPGAVRWNYFSYISKGDKLYFAMAHTDTSHNAMAYYTVIMVQIG